MSWLTFCVLGFVYAQIGLGTAAGIAFHDIDGIDNPAMAALCMFFWPIAWGYFFIKRCAGD